MPQVPTAALAYVEDLYVDFGLSQVPIPGSCLHERGGAPGLLVNTVTGKKGQGCRPGTVQ